MADLFNTIANVVGEQMAAAVFDILVERESAESQHGPQLDKPNIFWDAVILEELGEAAKASLHLELDLSPEDFRKWLQNRRDELCQVAASALGAMLAFENQYGVGARNVNPRVANRVTP